MADGRDTLGHRRERFAHFPSWREFTRMAGPSGRWPVALQAGVAVAAPVVVTALMGRTSLGLMLGLGIFAVLYATGEPTRPGVWLTAVVGAALIACASLGAAVHNLPWLHLPVMVAVSALAAGICRAVRLGPPGAYFFTLVCGVGGFIASHQGAAPVIAMTALGVLVAVVVAAVGSALKPARRGAHREHHPDQRDRRETEALVLRVALATGAAGLLAHAAGVEHTYWVVASAMLVVHQGDAPGPSSSVPCTAWWAPCSGWGCSHCWCGGGRRGCGWRW